MKERSEINRTTVECAKAPELFRGVWEHAPPELKKKSSLTYVRSGTFCMKYFLVLKAKPSVLMLSIVLLPRK